MTIKVRKAGWVERQPYFGKNREMRAATAWTVWQHDEYGHRDRLPYFVVRGPAANPFLTVIDGNYQMITTWHAGITPGDLARAVLGTGR